MLRQQMKLVCDKCPESIEVSSRALATTEARAKGWALKFEDGELLDICPKCQEDKE